MFHHTCTVILMYLLCFLLSGSMQNADGKPVSMICATTHPHHQGSFSSVSRGPLEPPKISKPWSLSCLRPAPPLKPSAALGYKEVENCTVAQTNPHQSLSISHSIHCQKTVPIAEVPFLCLPTAVSVFVGNLSSLTVMCFRLSLPLHHALNANEIRAIKTRHVINIKKRIKHTRTLNKLNINIWLIHTRELSSLHFCLVCYIFKMYKLNLKHKVEVCVYEL